MKKVSPRKCKGFNVAKGYGCEQLVLRRTHGLGHECGCYPNWLYNTPQGKQKISRAIGEVTKEKIELERAEKRIKNENRIKYLKVNVRNELHKFIRLRDKGLPCISCDRPYNSEFQAGHFYKAELFSNLKFNDMNIHGQCTMCNLRKEGNMGGFRIGLEKRYGKEFVDILDSIAEQRGNFKWEVEYLENIRAGVKLLIKELKINDMRNEITTLENKNFKRKL